MVSSKDKIGDRARGVGVEVQGHWFWGQGEDKKGLETETGEEDVGTSKIAELIVLS